MDKNSKKKPKKKDDNDDENTGKTPKEVGSVRKIGTLKITRLKGGGVLFQDERAFKAFKKRKKGDPIKGMETEEFAEEYLQALHAALHVIMEAYCPKDKEKFLGQVALAAMVNGGETTGPAGQHGHKVGTALVGSYSTVSLMVANTIVEMAKSRALEYGENINVAMTKAIAAVTEKSYKVLADNPEVTPEEGLQNEETAQSFADMVKDISADDIRNLLGE